MADTPQNKDPYMDGSGGWAVPQFNRGMTFTDIGSLGLRQYGGWVREEFLPQLLGRQAQRVFREMRDNSAVVSSIVFAITQAMRKVEWRTRPANDTPAAIQAADFADSLRTDMSHTWEDFVTEALTMLVYGFAPHEIVYKRRLGRNLKRKGPDGTPLPDSKYNDGLIGWRRLPIRGQDTVLKWFFGINGEIEGMTQQPWIGQLIDLPIDKMLLFRPSQHKNNPEGYSVLRGAYRPYFFIKRLEEQEAVMFERLSGLPVISVPSTLLDGVAAQDPASMAAFEAYKKMVTNVRIDEQMGLILPSDTFPNADGSKSSVKMFNFELVTPASGRTGVDADKSIERYKLDILMTVLADFIKMGHEVRGTNNLAAIKVDMFYQAIAGWLNSMASVLNRYGLQRIWDLNGLDLDLMPEYVPDMAQRIDLDSLGGYIVNLAQAGMQMFPDEDLQEFLRDAAGLPNSAEEGEYAPAGVTPDDIKKIYLAKAARGVLSRRRGYDRANAAAAAAAAQ